MAEITKRKVLVLILTYNEEQHISQVIDDVKVHVPFADVLVVDGESVDNTARLAKEKGVWIVSVPSRLGIAGGMEAGLLFANYRDYNYLIRVDGDGQHRAEDIGALLEPVMDGEADLVIGARFKKESGEYKASAPRLVANKLFAFLVSKIVGENLHDTTSGFQAMRRDVVRFLGDIENFEYSEVETVILLKKAGFRILEVPVVMNERVGSQSSFNFLRAFFYMFNGLFSLLLNISRKVERKTYHDS